MHMHVSGWHGLLIEANPHEYERLRRKGRSASILNGCLSRRPSLLLHVGGSLTAADDYMTGTRPKEIASALAAECATGAEGTQSNSCVMHGAAKP